jgi:hypothetical protein
MKRKRGTEVPRHTEWRKVMTMDEVAEYLRSIEPPSTGSSSGIRFRSSASAENWRFNIEDVNRWLQQKKSRRARFGSCVA